MKEQAHGIARQDADRMRRDMLMRKRSAWQQVMLLLGTALLATPPHAEEDLFELPLESLMAMQVSVASPFDESVMDSASSVSVLRAQQWQLRGARSLEDVMEQVPSVVPYASLGGASMFAIRGYANEISSRGTAMLLDGVPLNSYSYATGAYSLPFVSLDLLQRVEVIRGAGSTLYGSDAFHGVIALDTWQPDEAQQRVRVGAGAPEDARAAIVFAGDVSTAFRASGGLSAMRHRDDNIGYHFVEPASGVAGRGVRDNNEDNGSGFLRMDFGNSRDGLWRAGFFADRYSGANFPGTGTQFFQPLAALVQGFSVDYLGATDHMGQESDFALAQLQHVREIGNGFTLDVRTFRWQNDQLWMLDSTAYPTSVTRVSDNAVLPCRTSITESAATTSPLFCPHTQFQGTAEHRSGLHVLLRQTEIAGTQWAIGAGRDWFRVDEAPVRRIGLAGQVYYDAPAPFAGAGRQIDHLLLQARTDVRALSFVYGVRWDDYSDIGSATSPRLAVIYKPQARWSSKLLYGHAFRAPSAAEQYGSGGGTQQLPGLNIQPETIDTLEAVWQYRDVDHDTEIVVFGNRWLDGIVLVPIGGGVNQYQNSGKNNAHGIEITHHRNVGVWQFTGNVSWVVSENSRAGFDYVGFPAYIANLGISRPVGAGWVIGINQRLMLDMAEADVIGNVVPPRAPDYLRTDLHVGWQRDALSLALDVRNLFDRDNIVPSMFNARGGTPDAAAAWQLTVELAL